MKGFDLIAALTDEFRKRGTAGAEVVIRDADTKERLRDVNVKTARDRQTGETVTILEVRK